MSRRRRRASGPPKCPDCHAQTVWLKTMFTGSWRRYDVVPVNPRDYTGGEAYPTEGKWVWRLRDLVEDLMIRRDCSRADAEREAYDMQWRAVHRCGAPTRQGGEEQ